jgi:hypothetical protein
MSPLAEMLLREIEAKPRQFHEIVDAHRDIAWRDLLKGWGELRAANMLTRDSDGNYILASP